MPAVEARIETGRSSRYLTQLCRHVDSIYAERGSHGERPGLAQGRNAQGRNAQSRHAQDRPAEPPRVVWTEAAGTISFGDGTITLMADPAALILRAEAGSDESLQRAQELVTGLLARIGRRDGLTVTWQPAVATA